MKYDNYRTAKDRINDRTRSPTSTLVSCANCMRAPKNLRNFASARPWSCRNVGVVACVVDADDAGGGVVEPALSMCLLYYPKALKILEQIVERNIIRNSMQNNI